MEQYKGQSKLSEVPWEIRCKVRRAIMLIHNCARYFEGMQLLCEIAGYEKGCLTNKYDPIDERRRTRAQFNRWVKALSEAP